MENLIQAKIWMIAQTNHGSMVLLQPININTAIPIFIGESELQSIIIGKEKIHILRPMTHDLFIALFQKLNVVLKQVDIHDLKNNTFLARLVIEKKHSKTNKIFFLECRPSDAISIAVRCESPIFIASKIIKKTGIPVNFFKNEQGSINDGLEILDINSCTKESKDGQFSLLIKELNRALASEQYEKAAQIRDLLKMLEKTAEN